MDRTTAGQSPYSSPDPMDQISGCWVSLRSVGSSKKPSRSVALSAYASTSFSGACVAGRLNRSSLQQLRDSRTRHNQSLLHSGLCKYEIIEVMTQCDSHRTLLQDNTQPWVALGDSGGLEKGGREGCKCQMLEPGRGTECWKTIPGMQDG